MDSQVTARVLEILGFGACVALLGRAYRDVAASQGPTRELMVGIAAALMVCAIGAALDARVKRRIVPFLLVGTLVADVVILSVTFDFSRLWN